MLIKLQHFNNIKLDIPPLLFDHLAGSGQPFKQSTGTVLTSVRDNK